MVMEEMHLQENTLFDPYPRLQGQDNTKFCSVPSTSCDLCTCKICSCYVQRFMRRCIYKKRDRMMERQTDGRPTLVRNYFTFLSKEKSGYNYRYDLD